MSLESEIIRLRRDKGYSCVKIHALVKDEYKVSRDKVRSILISLGLMSPNLAHGGYRPGSGKGSKYLLEGVILDSYAELCYYLQYKNVLGLIKNTEVFDVGDHKYVPDFVDRYGIYYEIKSATDYDFWGWNVNKLEGFNKSLVVITRDELTSIIRDVEESYGKDYLDSLIWVGSWRGTQEDEGFALEKR